MASGRGMPRLAAWVKLPDRSPCAEYSPGANPAISARCLRIALTDCGSSVRRDTVPHRPIAQTTQAVGVAGRQQFRQDIAGDRLGALAKTLSRDSSDRASGC